MDLHHETITQHGFEFKIVREVREVDRYEEMNLNPFHQNLEPGTWEMKFKIDPSGWSLEIFFGRTFNPQKNAQAPDTLRYRRIAQFPSCTSIDVHREYPDQVSDILMVNCTIRGRRLKLPVPVSFDNYYNEDLYDDWRRHFERRNIDSAIVWANNIFSARQTTKGAAVHEHQHTQVDIQLVNQYLVHTER